MLTRVSASVLGSAVVLATIGFAPDARASSNIVGTGTVPAYSYAQAIRESVWVQAPMDSDGDGSPDRIAVDIVRPREPAEAGVRIPAIVEASPYFGCCGRGNENELKAYDAAGTIAKVPLYYDNYFVPRGYAFVAVDLAGTNRSTGCEDVGGAAEVAGAKAVIDWLNGRAGAFFADGSPAVADWTTGKAAMIGKSWDGSIANGVAATGVPGLETIVPISAISSWYDYTRFNGVLRSRDYPAFLHSFVTGRPVEACAAALAGMRSASGEDTGSYNRFWQERDYRPGASRVRASVFAVHGVNDTNVTTTQFAQWWNDLAAQGVPRKLWLHQAGHEDPFDVRRTEWVETLHRWFDFWLQGLDNGITREPAVSIETNPGVWTDQPAWPAQDVHETTVPLGTGVVAYQDRSMSENTLVSDPTTAKAGRLVFLSGPLTAPVRISGTSTVRLRVRVNQPTTQLTARLVDYGTATRIDPATSEGVRSLTTQSCWGDSTAADDACYLDTEEVTRTNAFAVLTRGWLDAAHHLSPRLSVPLRADTWYAVTVPLNAYETVVPAGHLLGLVLSQSDTRFTAARNNNATVEVDLAASTLMVPLAGDANLPAPGVAPHVAATPSEVDSAAPAPPPVPSMG
jgi:X-Pro dipeptidyl-peptidase